jgi:hypothetical protein
MATSLEEDPWHSQESSYTVHETQWSPRRILLSVRRWDLHICTRPAIGREAGGGGFGKSLASKGISDSTPKMRADEGRSILSYRLDVIFATRWTFSYFRMASRGSIVGVGVT